MDGQISALSYLDSMRGLAISGVVMTHVGQTVSGTPELLNSFAQPGLRAIQLFFVVSALTLCLVTQPGNFRVSSFDIALFSEPLRSYTAGVLYLLMNAVLGI